MRSSIIASVALSYTTIISAQLCDVPSSNGGAPTAGIFSINVDTVVQAGQPTNIKWSGSPQVDTVSIQLLSGPATNLQAAGCLTNSVKNSDGSFSWTPPTTLPADGYGIKILANPSGDFEYSNHFELKNSQPSSSSTSVVSSSSVASTQASSSNSVQPSSTSNGQSISSSASLSSSGTASSTQASYSSGTLTYPQYTSLPYGSGIFSPSPSSSGFPSNSANASAATHTRTHSANYQITFSGSGSLQTVQPTDLPTIIASSGAAVNSTQYVKPTGPLTVPSSLQAVTQTAVAGGGATTPVVTGSGSPGASASPSPLVANGAGRIGAGSMIGLGAVIALML